MSYKASLKQLLGFLKLAGVEVAANDEDVAEFNPDELLAAIDNSRMSVLKPRIEEEIKPGIQSALAGQQTGAIRSQLNQILGTAGQGAFKDLDIKDMLAKAFELHTQKFGADAEGLRQQLTALAAEKDTLNTEWETRHNNEVAALNQKFVDRDINEELFEIVNSLPRTGGNPMQQTKDFRNHLNGLLHLHYNEKGEKGKRLEPRELENKESPYFNKEKTRPADLAELAKAYGADAGWLAKDMRHNHPMDTMNQQQNQNQNNYFNPVPADGVQGEVNRLLA